MIFLFVIAIIVVIAGYNFIQGFSTSAFEENNLKVFISTLKGLSIISIGIFILILVAVLVFDNSIRELRENLQIGFEAVINLHNRNLQEIKKIEDIIERKLNDPAIVEENELLKKELSAKNDNIKGLLYRIESLEEETTKFEEKINKLQKKN